MSVVLMSKRELNRIDILARLDSGRLTPGAAATLLQVSERQVYRLRRRFQDGGPAAIADRRRGRPSNNRLPALLRDQAVALVREPYADFGPTLAAEKLKDRHDLRVSRETLRSWMIQPGLWRPRAERTRFPQPRHRREHLGELIQIDGCAHRWFEDRGPPCTLDGMNQLGDILCWRETRRVSRQLVVHYNRMKFTLHPSEITARLVGQEVEIYDFPDGRLEIRWKGLPLAYSVFDKLQRVSHAAIVENKRLGEVLAWIKERQDAQPAPSGDRVGPRRSSQKSGLMKDRVDRLARAAQPRPKLERLGCRRSDQKVSAPPPQAPSHPA